MGKITIVILFLTFWQSALAQKQDVDWCKKMNQKSVDYIYNFQMSSDSAYLDSALVCTNKALEYCSDFKLLLSFRKLDILSKKRDFIEAISFIKSFDDPLLKDLPYYNNYLLNRFTAMSYQLKGDVLNRNHYLTIISKDLKKYIFLNKEKIDSLIKVSNMHDILKDPLHLVLVDYYYNRSVLCGFEDAKTELDSLQKAEGGNPKYFDFISLCLKNNFMDFVGY